MDQIIMKYAEYGEPYESKSNLNYIKNEDDQEEGVKMVELGPETHNENNKLITTMTPPAPLLISRPPVVMTQQEMPHQEEQSNQPEPDESQIMDIIIEQPEEPYRSPSNRYVHPSPSLPDEGYDHYHALNPNMHQRHNYTRAAQQPQLFQVPQAPQAPQVFQVHQALQLPSMPFVPSTSTSPQPQPETYSLDDLPLMSDMVETPTSDDIDPVSYFICEALLELGELESIPLEVLQRKGKGPPPPAPPPSPADLSLQYTSNKEPFRLQIEIPNSDDYSKAQGESSMQQMDSAFIEPLALPSPLVASQFASDLPSPSILFTEMYYNRCNPICVVTPTTALFIMGALPSPGATGSGGVANNTPSSLAYRDDIRALVVKRGHDTISNSDDDEDEERNSKKFKLE
ncbi:hypothetical protein MBANPS3_000819 [Mucor bainieri]